MQQRIFERFFKVDEFIPGAGLGLSVCQSLAFSLGGKVGVESTLGKGSTFWVEIPIL
jgi:signal transduction histidine kinase